MTTPSNEWLLAVDFGTSNTAAAHTTTSGGVETVALTHTGNLMSSSVFVAGRPEAGRLVTGRPEAGGFGLAGIDRIETGDVAINRAETNPAAFVVAPKRLVGHGTVHVDGYDLPTSALVTAVIGSVLTRASAAHRGQRPSGLVLTHPEDWSPREIDVLVQSAAALGYEGSAVTLLSEPRAAAHFFSRTGPVPAGSTIAVFDFGGGTLDVAVMAATDRGTFDVVAARGDNGLGGKNLDALLRRWLDRQLAQSDPELLEYLNAGAPLHVLRTLDESIRRAKELLSSTNTALIAVGDSRSDRRRTVTITRDEFDEIVDAEITRAVSLARATLRDAGITGSKDLTALFLTGGSSRIPLVHSRLAELGPLATLDDPKTVVANGALIAVTRSPAPVAPVRPDAVPPAIPRRRRSALIASATGVVVAILAVTGVWFALSRGSGDVPTPVATAASVVPGSDEDVAALEDAATDYAVALGTGTRAQLDPMRCSTAKWLTPEEPAPPSRVVTVEDFASVRITGDTASLGVNVKITMDGEPEAHPVLLMEYARESGVWKLCSGTVQ